jgi:hypothetical protein
VGEEEKVEVLGLEEGVEEMGVGEKEGELVKVGEEEKVEVLGLEEGVGLVEVMALEEEKGRCTQLRRYRMWFAGPEEGEGTGYRCCKQKFVYHLKYHPLWCRAKMRRIHIQGRQLQRWSFARQRYCSWK